MQRIVGTAFCCVNLKNAELLVDQKILSLVVGFPIRLLPVFSSS
jgi:hypothetical protein